VLRGLLAVVPVSLLIAGCGSDSPTTHVAEADASVYDSTQQHSDWTLGDADDFNAEIALEDGRVVSFYYAKGKGLAEQHYSPDADAWTKPRIVYRTATDPCQGIALDAADGTVAVTADWALYCYDGEPPSESVVGVAAGDLTDWATDLTEGFDGWSAPEVGDGGDRVEWSYHGDVGVAWTREGGFEKSLGDG
jgi:major membrane immunogen (membrane-anchored lipoprotein)